MNATGHLVTQRVRILPRTPPPLPALLPSRTSTPNPESSSHNLPHLPLTNPFKAMKHKSSDNLSVIPSLANAGRVVLDGEVVVGAGELGVTGSLRVRRVGEELRGIGWSSKGEIVVGPPIPEFK